MGILSENPFLVTEKAIQSINTDADIIIADFHGEATAEKIAFGKYFDGKINCIFGTHTHVQTADEEVFEKGSRIYNRYWNDSEVMQEYLV